MQAVPESRQQTFEELYGPPENFLEIEVRLASTFPLRYWSISAGAAMLSKHVPSS